MLEHRQPNCVHHQEVVRANIQGKYHLYHQQILYCPINSNIFGVPFEDSCELPAASAGKSECWVREQRLERRLLTQLLQCLNRCQYNVRIIIFQRFS